MQTHLLISATRSLTWEFLARIWPGLLATLSCFLGLPALLQAVTRAKGVDFFTEDMMSVPMHYGGLAACVCVYAACIMGAQSEKGFEFPPRLFWLPLSNRFLMGLKCLQAVVAAFVLYLVTVMLFETLFGIASPLWGPAVFAAVATLFIQAMFLSLADFRFWKLVTWGTLLATVLWWLDSRYHNRGYNAPGTLWNVMTFTELLTMIAFGLAMFTVSLRSVERQRCGDSAGWTHMRKWADRIEYILLGLFRVATTVVPRSMRTPDRFHSPAEAHFWIEWKTKGIGMPFFTIILLGTYSAIVPFAVWWGTTTPTEWLDVLLNVIWFGTVSLSFFIGILVGSTNLTTGQNSDFHMRDFSGVLPLDDRTMAGIHLRNAATSLLLSALIAAVFIGLFCIWVAVADGPAQLEHVFGLQKVYTSKPGFTHVATLLGGFFFPALSVGALIVGWSLMGISMSQSLTGRKWIIGAPYIVTAAIFIVLMPITSLMSNDTADLFWLVFASAFGLLLLAGVVLSFVVALRWRMIARSTTVACLLITLVICVLTTAYALHIEEKAVNALLFYYGICSLPVAPFATAPLALYFNRHR